MKTITKTFYVSDECFERIKNNSIGFSTNESDVFNNQIQISWLEPEKKIEISSSDIDKLRKKYIEGTISIEQLEKEFFNGDLWEE